MRGSKAKQLRREAARINEAPVYKRDREYHITEIHQQRMVEIVNPETRIMEPTPVEIIKLVFAALGAYGHYKRLKREYKRSVAYRHWMAGRAG